MFGWFKKTLLHVLPVFVFFFVVFSLVDFTKILVVYTKTGVLNYTFLVIFLGALLMAKVVVISDELPFIDLFAKKPLIYSTIWKAAIYFMASIVVRILERFVPNLVQGNGYDAASQAAVDEMGRLTFWIAQVWLAILLLFFVASQELISAVGKDKVRKLFFGN
jgi:hypothetical protein